MRRCGGTYAHISFADAPEVHFNVRPALVAPKILSFRRRVVSLAVFISSLILAEEAADEVSLEFA